MEKDIEMMDKSFTGCIDNSILLLLYQMKGKLLKKLATENQYRRSRCNLR